MYQKPENQTCRLSKYHSQKPESTRRTIFNRGSILQLIVQISSGNVNSSVRARAKTHGRTPVSIELPRGRHLGSDACIFWARMPASTLHKSAQQRAPEAYISMCKSTTQDARAQKMPASTFSGARPRRCPRRPPHTRVEGYARHPLGVHTEMHAPRHTRV